MTIRDRYPLVYAFGVALYLGLGVLCGMFVLLVALAVVTAR